MAVSIRQWHSYLGLFIAPSVLFFTVTGALQLFSLHEAHGSYRPPALIEKLSSVHKDQVFALGHHDDAPEPAAPADGHAAAPPGGAPDDDDKTAASTWALKVFFLVVAIGLTLSTCFGLWMGLTQTRRKRLAWSLAIAGTLIPLALLCL
jgi:hypothetical protein